MKYIYHKLTIILHLSIENFASEYDYQTFSLATSKKLLSLVNHSRLLYRTQENQTFGI